MQIDHSANYSAAPVDKSPAVRRPWLRPLGWCTAILFTLCAGLFAWLVLDKIEAQSRRDIAGMLTAVLNTSEEAMRHLVVMYKEDVQTWASSTDVQENVKMLLLEPRARERLLSSPAQANLRGLLRPILEKRGYVGIFVVALDNTSLASMRDSNVGSTNLLVEQGDFLAKIFAGQTLLSRPMYSDVLLPDATGKLVEGQPTMFVAAPVRDEHGAVIAALTFRIVPYRDFSRIARLGRFGETVDTYGFDRSGKLLTESLFHEQLKEIGLLAPDQHELLTLEIRDPGGNMVKGYRPQISRAEQPLTRMAIAAVSKKSGVDVDGYRDYRGVEVVGAWTWDDELRFAMTTEMDYAEAYGPYHNTRWLLLIGLSLIVGLFVSLSAMLSTGRSRALHLAEQMTLALRDSEHRYRSLVQTAGNVIVYLSPEHRILEFNDEAERVHAAQREEVLGEDYYEQFVPEVSLKLFTEAEHSLPGDPTKGSFESSVRAADDRQPLLLWNLTRLLDDEGKPLGIIAVGQDITEHKRAEERALLAERLASEYCERIVSWGYFQYGRPVLGSEASNWYKNYQRYYQSLDLK
ncbi:MAG: PAS domain S-box protein [Pirellulales bacterium]